MKTDGLFETASYDILVESTTKPTKIIPVGDIHFGAELHAEDVFESFLRYARKQKNAYFLFMGDQWDALSATEQRTLKKELAKEGLRDESAKVKMDRLFIQDFNALAKKLDFMKGRVLGVLGGNHGYEFKDGMNIDQKLAERLETQYLGVLGCVKIMLYRNGNNRIPLWIWAHHGKGGTGKTVGHQFNCVDDMAQFLRGDIYCMGDNHGVGVVPGKDELVPFVNVQQKNRVDVKAHRRWLCRTGSFLKGYVPGKKSYIVDRLYRPNSLGWVELDVYFKVKNSSGVNNKKTGRAKENFIEVVGITH